MKGYVYDEVICESRYVDTESPTPDNYIVFSTQRKAKVALKKMKEMEEYNMDRETLFKAKQYDTKEWIEGLPRYDVNGDITEFEVYKGFCNREVVTVDPETICRCTGKEYMDGEAAYEGDIFESQACGLKMILKYGTYQSYCPEDNEYMDNVGFYAEAKGYPHMPIGDLSDYALKVGNIFDNPDLLEGGVKNE